MEPQKKHCTILIKRRVSGDPGPPASLAHGELAFNEVDNSLYIQTDNPSVSSTDLGTF